MELSKIKILIVDDDADFREVVKDLVVNALGMVDITQVSNGHDGLKKVTNQKFDLIITDIEMPRMNGRRFITELGGLDANVKPRACFVVSGQVSRESMVSEISNVTFFSKPLDTEQFTSQLRKLFQPSKPEVKTTKNKVDIEFINPFIDATLKVLSITAGIAAKKEEVFIRKSDQISGDISALIAMNSQEYLGSFAVSFSEKCFLSVVNSMLGENYTAITAEIQDAAAEVCNQIFGMAKKILNENGHTIQPAIPSVISGKSHSIKHTIGGVCIGVKFSTPAGPFQVEAVIKEK